MRTVESTSTAESTDLETRDEQQDKADTQRIVASQEGVDPRDSVFLERKTSCANASLAKLEAQIRKLERRVDEALAENITTSPDCERENPERITVWGVPFTKLTLASTLHDVDRLIARGKPGYFITSNLNYNMLTRQHPRLREVNNQASFICCDGMPMVWWSKFLGNPLAERVAGSELIYALSMWAAKRGHRIFFLGGAPGIAQKAADTLSARYPGLEVAGVESPPFRPLTEQENSELVARIRGTKPDILYVAFGQPKGELWISENVDQLGVPVCAQIGASFDFVAGGVPRAPIILQKTCLEWAYRLYQEPKRLTGRYFNNGAFLIRSVCSDLLGKVARRSAK